MKLIYFSIPFLMAPLAISAQNDTGYYSVVAVGRLVGSQKFGKTIADTILLTSTTTGAAATVP